MWFDEPYFSPLIPEKFFKCFPQIGALCVNQDFRWIVKNYYLGNGFTKARFSEGSEEDCGLYLVKGTTLLKCQHCFIHSLLKSRQVSLKSFIWGSLKRWRRKHLERVKHDANSASAAWLQRSQRYPFGGL